METIRIPHTDFEASRLIYGCMRLTGAWNVTEATDEAMQRTRAAVDAALEAGINFFDHADIYAGGGCEKCFGQLFRERPSLRDGMVLQTKCGIRFEHERLGGSMYDFSYEHITQSAEGCLRRLNVDTIDILLLHRPDALMEPEEVARAFDDLQQAGKVKHFGVSNHSGQQIDLLKKCVRQPMVANQLELSLLHSGLIDAGTAVNRKDPHFHGPGEGTLEYCRLHDIPVQAWSPLAQGKLSPAKAGDEHAELRERIDDLATQNGVNPEAILIAWLLRHPGKMQPIIGSCDPARIAASARGVEVALSRVDWYELYVLARQQRMA